MDVRAKAVARVGEQIHGSDDAITLRQTVKASRSPAPGSIARRIAVAPVQGSSTSRWKVKACGADLPVT
jgi:hypothetical protein